MSRNGQALIEVLRELRITRREIDEIPTPTSQLENFTKLVLREKELEDELRIVEKVASHNV